MARNRLKILALRSEFGVTILKRDNLRTQRAAITTIAALFFYRRTLCLAEHSPGERVAKRAIDSMIRLNAGLEFGHRRTATDVQAALTLKANGDAGTDFGVAGLSGIREIQGVT